MWQDINFNVHSQKLVELKQFSKEDQSKSQFLWVMWKTHLVADAAKGDTSY